MRAGAEPRREAGGLFSGKMEWATVVNREGEILRDRGGHRRSRRARGPAARRSPRPRPIRPTPTARMRCRLSTARLYTLSQPGHSLWGVGRAQSVQPGLSRLARRRRRDRRQDSAAARSPSAVACRSIGTRRASAASGSAATRRAPITKSPSVSAISRSRPREGGVCRRHHLQQRRRPLGVHASAVREHLAKRHRRSATNESRRLLDIVDAARPHGRHADAVLPRTGVPAPRPMEKSATKQAGTAGRSLAPEGAGEAWRVSVRRARIAGKGPTT